MTATEPRKQVLVVRRNLHASDQNLINTWSSVDICKMPCK